MKEKSLFQLKRFWVSAFLILLVAFLSAIYIFCTSNLVYVSGYKGVNGFLEAYKVPLGILALLFPVIALVAASHRSEQTKKQIIISESQNNFANYYKHVEEFGKLIEKSKVKYSIKEQRVSFLYTRLFPSNTSMNFEFISHGTNGGISFLETIDVIISSAVDSMSQISSNDEVEVIGEKLKFFYSSVASVSMFVDFKIDNNSLNYAFISADPFMEVVKVAYKDDDPFYHFKKVVSFVNDLRFFCHLEDKVYIVECDSRIAGQARIYLESKLW